MATRLYCAQAMILLSYMDQPCPRTYSIDFFIVIKSYIHKYMIPLRFFFSQSLGFLEICLYLDSRYLLKHCVYTCNVQLTSVITLTWHYIIEKPFRKQPFWQNVPRFLITVLACCISTAGLKDDFLCLPVSLTEPYNLNAFEYNILQYRAKNIFSHSI